MYKLNTENKVKTIIHSISLDKIAMIVAVIAINNSGINNPIAILLFLIFLFCIFLIASNLFSDQ